MKFESITITSYISNVKFADIPLSENNFLPIGKITMAKGLWFESGLCTGLSITNVHWSYCKPVEKLPLRAISFHGMVVLLNPYIIRKWMIRGLLEMNGTQRLNHPILLPFVPSLLDHNTQRLQFDIDQGNNSIKILV